MEKVELNENEKIVLKCLDDVTDHWGERCVPFKWIAGDGNTLTAKEVGVACRGLRSKGLADFHRGLMTEDGEVAGSGYCISSDGQLFLRPCVDCKISKASMTDERCQACWENRRCTNCGRPYKEHESDWSNGGNKIEFEFLATNSNK